MKPIDELRAFAEGYLEGVRACNADLYDWDDWVLWGDYDINFFGTNYDINELTTEQLRVVAYPGNWEGDLPAPIHEFTVGETK